MAPFRRLPEAPVNASPVPHLSSLYHFARAGEFGSLSYPGNCGGNLIRDLLLYCTDIVRFSHGASTGKKVYRTSFIPGLHDICAIFERFA